MLQITSSLLYPCFFSWFGYPLDEFIAKLSKNSPTLLLGTHFTLCGPQPHFQHQSKGRHGEIPASYVLSDWWALVCQKFCQKTHFLSHVQLYIDITNLSIFIMLNVCSCMRKLKMNYKNFHFANLLIKKLTSQSPCLLPLTRFVPFLSLSRVSNVWPIREFFQKKRGRFRAPPAVFSLN